MPTLRIPTAPAAPARVGRQRLSDRAGDSLGIAAFL
jgi:hypothetical protein